MIVNAKVSDYKTAEQIQAEYDRMMTNGMG